MKNRFYKVTNSSPKLGEVPQAEESVMTIATSALTDSLGASATPPNLGGESRYSIRKASVLCTLCSVLCMLMSCSEEQDLLVPEQTNALHITSVTIDGQQVARTRVVADDGTYDYSMSNQPYNQSFRMFTGGDALQLVTNGLSAGEAGTNQFYAIYNDDGTWAIADPQDVTNPVSLKPTDTWANASIEAAAFGGGELSGTSEDYPSKSQGMGIVQGDIDVSKSLILGDRLVADKSNGSITIDTDVKSPTLGAVTIKLKHAHALLRLPQSAVKVTSGTYIVNGTAHNVTDLGTLWAEVQYDGSTYYYPLTEVDDYLQAIVPADNEGSYTLTGFKAVMNVSGSSESTESSATLTLDLPFKVGTENSSPESEEVPQAEGYALQPNHQYPLTLNIAPHTASVTLSSRLGKPGWGTDEDEEELSNLLNEPITVDGTQYIKLDGTATDVEKVKSIIEAATAAGYTNFYVTGETLAEYDDENSLDEAHTVVGEAIRTSAQGTVSLLLPEATMIWEKAFFYCAALKSVSAPNATSIEYSAFYSCTALTSVSAPKATSIEKNAFASCPALTSLTFGSVIESVGKDPFIESSTMQCALTLNIDQQSSMDYPVGTDENGEPTWAGYIWASISYVDDEGNAVESN